MRRGARRAADPVPAFFMVVPPRQKLLDVWPFEGEHPPPRHLLIAVHSLLNVINQIGKKDQRLRCICRQRIFRQPRFGVAPRRFRQRKLPVAVFIAQFGHAVLHEGFERRIARRSQNGARRVAR
ncbi:MAG: hypothetical protein KatS3mg058_4597 [Roseiflexus sp.]|nr:MAG: hypothetical protein KatS3mg058_4597 [Roseiflexus sp.]